MANDLSATLELGEGYLEQGEIENAVAVFEAVANGVLEHYGEFHDEISRGVCAAQAGRGG